MAAERSTSGINRPYRRRELREDPARGVANSVEHITDALSRLGHGSAVSTRAMSAGLNSAGFGPVRSAAVSSSPTSDTRLAATVAANSPPKHTKTTEALATTRPRTTAIPANNPRKNGSRRPAQDLNRPCARTRFPRSESQYHATSTGYRPASATA
jgi:hypothetical protein